MTPRAPKDNVDRQLTQVVTNTGGVDIVIENKKGQVEGVMQNGGKNSKVNQTTKLKEEAESSQIVSTRICLLRHLPYLEDKNHQEYERLRKQLGEDSENFNFDYFGQLDDGLKTDLSKLDAGLFDRIFQDQANTILIHNEFNSSKKRIQESINYIKDTYPNIQILSRNIVGSKKGTDKRKAVLNAGEELIEILLEIEKSPLYKGKNVIILGSRSHSHFLRKETFDKQGKDKSEKEFEEKGYDFIDLDCNANLIDTKMNLIITPHNYPSLPLPFLKIPHTSLIDLQNKLNAHFMRNPQLFEEYISSDNIDLQIFCIINLIKRSKFDTIHENRNKLLNPKIEQALVKANPRYKILSKYYKKIYPDVLKAKGKSLDKRIRDGKNIEPIFSFSNETYNENILNLLSGSKSIKYIQGNAGNGKSFLLTQIAEKAHKYNFENIHTQKSQFHCVYINLSGKRPDILDNIEAKDGYTNVLLLDSIDESDAKGGDDRKEFDSRLSDLSNDFKIVITSRNGYLYEYDKSDEKEKGQGETLELKQEIIELKDFNGTQRKKYLEKYFGDDTKKMEKAEEVVLKLNGTGNNPLILLMICDLIKNDDPILQEINISITDIYESVIRERLINGDNKDKNRKLQIGRPQKEIIDTRIDFLSKIGYKMLVEGRLILAEEIDLIKRSDDKYIDRLHLDLESIDLLFKQNTDGSYDFVHQSFKEYFAAIRLFEKIKEEGVFDLKILESYDYKIIEFLCGFIKKDEQLKKNFLDYMDDVITRPDEYKGKIHYMGKLIYIFGKLDPKKEGQLNKGIFILNQHSSWNLKLIEGMMRLRTKENIKKIQNFLEHLINNDGESKGYDKGKYYIPLIRLFISEGLEKELFDVLYQEVYIKNNVYFLNEEVIDVLYANVPDKIEFIKAMIANNDLDGYSQEHLFKLIAAHHVDDLREIIGDRFKNKYCKIKELIDFKKNSIEVKMLIELLKIGNIPPMNTLRSYKDFFIYYMDIVGFDIEIYLHILKKFQDRKKFARELFKKLLEKSVEEMINFKDQIGLKKEEIREIIESEFQYSFIGIPKNLRKIYTYPVDIDLYKLTQFLISRLGDKYGSMTFKKIIDFLNYLGYGEPEIQGILKKMYRENIISYRVKNSQYLFDNLIKICIQEGDDILDLLEKFQDIRVSKETIEDIIEQSQGLIENIATYSLKINERPPMDPAILNSPHFYELETMKQHNLEKSINMEYKRDMQIYLSFIQTLGNLWQPEFENAIKELFNKIKQLEFYSGINYNALFLPLIELILEKFDKDNMGFLDDFIEENKENLDINSLLGSIGAFGKTKYQVRIFRNFILQSKNIRLKHGIPTKFNHIKVNSFIESEFIRLCIEENCEEDILYIIPNYIPSTDL